MMNINANRMGAVVAAALAVVRDHKRWTSAIIRAAIEIEKNPYMHMDGRSLMVPRMVSSVGRVEAPLSVTSYYLSFRFRSCRARRSRTARLSPPVYLPVHQGGLRVRHGFARA